MHPTTRILVWAFLARISVAAMGRPRTERPSKTSRTKTLAGFGCVIARCLREPRAELPARPPHATTDVMRSATKARTPTVVGRNRGRPRIARQTTLSMGRIEGDTPAPFDPGRHTRQVT